MKSEDAVPTVPLRPTTPALFKTGYLMYCPVTVDDHPLSLMVDSGASHSLLPRKLLKRIAPSVPLKTLPYPLHFDLADGHSAMKCTTFVELHLKIGGLNIPQVFFVLDAETADPILGNDFLVEHEFIMDAANTTLTKGDTTVKCFRKSTHIRCYRCVAKQTVTLQPAAETLISIAMVGRDGSLPDLHVSAMVEPRTHLARKGLLPCPTILQPTIRNLY